jgi:hypothetical protein
MFLEMTFSGSIDYREIRSGKFPEIVLRDERFRGLFQKDE